MKSSPKLTHNRHLRSPPLVQQRCLDSRNFHLLQSPFLQVQSSVCLSFHVQEELSVGAQLTKLPCALVSFSRSAPSYMFFPLRHLTHHRSPSRRSTPPRHPPPPLPHRLHHPLIPFQLLFDRCTFMSMQPVADKFAPKSAHLSPAFLRQPL